ncbi:U-box domain-containing protein [Baffinella frigidus]|nr:U-box domain-containing protein [Cryptophyta sp. CCMP2293]
MGEAPEEFMDPIMQTLMLDPVKLPSSGVIVDRKVIVRHLMTDPHDPFNRAPLDQDDLVDMPALKEQIAQYLCLDDLVDVPALKEQIEQYRAACLAPSLALPPGIKGSSSFTSIIASEAHVQ